MLSRNRSQVWEIDIMLSRKIENDFESMPHVRHRKLELTKNYFSAYLFRGGNESGLWSTRGCKLDDSASNGTHSVCRCNHLTNFAILMKVKSDTTKVKDVTFHIIKTAYTWTFCSPPHKIFMRAKQRKEMSERGAGKERLSLAYRPGFANCSGVLSRLSSLVSRNAKFARRLQLLLFVSRKVWGS